ncbi:MAG: toll/interleukin-1 receptor domain-containing protein [Candidatus Saccharimonas sp.]|nr:toll/interleukin-1 receptor domain-containing protein [Planctomycetaceae bacterium]
MFDRPLQPLLHDIAVHELAADLRDLGLLSWIDEEQLLPGDVVQERLERAIEHAGAIAVCIGPSGLSPGATLEFHRTYARFIRESERDDDFGDFRSDRGLRVIPVLLPGAEQKQIPAFLKRHLYVDLRTSAASRRPEELRKLATAVLSDRG